MGQIITGAEISTYKTSGITISVAKKENRNGVKSKFIILQAKDKGSLISKASRIVLFEDELPAEIFDVLSKYRTLNKDGKPVQDARGGYPIDMKAFKASEDAEEYEGLLTLDGGMVMDYDLGGAYYANDIDGNQTKDGRGNPVIKTTISVFVQVKNFIPTADGGLQPVFFAGMGLNDRGSRMKAQFYRTPVEQAVAPTEHAGESGTGDPF